MSRVSPHLEILWTHFLVDKQIFLRADNVVDTTRVRHFSFNGRRAWKTRPKKDQRPQSASNLDSHTQSMLTIESSPTAGQTGPDICNIIPINTVFFYNIFSSAISKHVQWSFTVWFSDFHQLESLCCKLIPYFRLLKKLHSIVFNNNNKNKGCCILSLCHHGLSTQIWPIHGWGYPIFVMRSVTMVKLRKKTTTSASYYSNHLTFTALNNAFLSFLEFQWHVHPLPVLPSYRESSLPYHTYKLNTTLQKSRFMQTIKISFHLLRISVSW